MSRDLRDLKEAHDAAIKIGMRAQVDARGHVYEGMVGNVEAINRDGTLKMESNSGTRFWAKPEHVRVVQPS